MKEIKNKTKNLSDFSYEDNNKEKIREYFVTKQTDVIKKSSKINILNAPTSEIKSSENINKIKR